MEFASCRNWVTLVVLTAANVPLLVCGEQAQGASAAVYLNAPFADRGLEPTEFSPTSGPGPGAASLPGVGYVQALKWTSWGGPEATGTGRVRLLTDRTSASTVSVTLRGARNCGGVMAYSTYSLQLPQGSQQPRYWPSGQTGGFPCRISAGAYIPGSALARRPEAQGGCVFHGLEIHNQGAPGLPWLAYIFEPPAISWNPGLPRGSAYSGFCRMQWSTWGAQTVTGKGVLRTGVKQWGVKVQVGQPAWCRGLGVAYSRLVMTLYGSGEPISGQGNISQGAANRLRSEIHRPGLSRRTYRQLEPASAGCTS